MNNSRIRSSFKSCNSHRRHLLDVVASSTSKCLELGKYLEDSINESSDPKLIQLVIEMGKCLEVEESITWLKFKAESMGLIAIDEDDIEDSVGVVVGNK